MRVESSVSNQSSEEVFWRLNGASAGPTLLVLGDPDELRDAVERLQSLPSLVYLRGTLLVAASRPAESVDAELCLVGGHVRDAYWSILAEAARMGMISGRGIPATLRGAA